VEPSGRPRGNSNTIAADPVVGVGGLHSPVRAIATLSSGEDPWRCGHRFPGAPCRRDKAWFGKSTVRFGATTVKDRRQRAEGRAPTKNGRAFCGRIAPPGLEPGLSWSRGAVV